MGTPDWLQLSLCHKIVILDGRLNEAMRNNSKLIFVHEYPCFQIVLCTSLSLYCRLQKRGCALLPSDSKFRTGVQARSIGLIRQVDAGITNRSTLWAESKPVTQYHIHFLSYALMTQA